MPEQFDIQHNSIDIILKNTVQAELVHVLIVPSVLIPIFLFGHTNYFLIVTILSIISAIWDTQYIILQRFNRPRILIMKDAIKQDII